MATLVIKSFPEALHIRLKEKASAHRRSVTQETIFLLEQALKDEEEQTLDERGATQNRVADPGAQAQSYWNRRQLLPEYEAMLKAGALQGGTDSSEIISEERDAR